MATVGLCLFLGSGPSLRAESPVEADGVVLTAVEDPSSKLLPEYWPFRIRARNRTSAPRTVHAEVALSAMIGGERRPVARCLVYRELKPRASASWLQQCRSKEKYSHWRLLIRRVWPFRP